MKKYVPKEFDVFDAFWVAFQLFFDAGFPPAFSVDRTIKPLP